MRLLGDLLLEWIEGPGRGTQEYPSAVLVAQAVSWQCLQDGQPRKEETRAIYEAGRQGAD